MHYQRDSQREVRRLVLQRLGRADRDAPTLPGWTRGLWFHGSTAFVGASRVIPRFSNYAPGFDVDD